MTGFLLLVVETLLQIPPHPQPGPDCSLVLPPQLARVEASLLSGPGVGEVLVGKSAPISFPSFMFLGKISLCILCPGLQIFCTNFKTWQ